MATRSLRPAYRESLMQNPIHLMRWLKAQALGGSEEAAAKAIAATERVKVGTIIASIREVDAYRKKNDKVEFDYALRDLVISAIPQAKQALTSLLTATELVEVKDAKTGKTRVERAEDKTTRLEALRVLNSIASAQIPKGPLIEQTIAQTTQVAAISGGPETIEERMRRLRQKAQEFNQLPPEVAAVPKHIEEGEDAEDDEDDDDEEE